MSCPKRVGQGGKGKGGLEDWDFSQLPHREDESQLPHTKVRWGRTGKGDAGGEGEGDWEGWQHSVSCCTGRNAARILHMEGRAGGGRGRLGRLAAQRQPLHRAAGAVHQRAVGEGGGKASDPSLLHDKQPALNFSSHHRAACHALLLYRPPHHPHRCHAPQIHDVIETLGRVHGSHRKLLRARHARLWVCLEKMGSAEAHVDLTSAHVQALHEDMEGKRRELVRIDQRVAEVEKFVETLKTEVGLG